jgi:two-component system response regulator YesN
MYNVMIVEDEPTIRYAIKASVNWGSLDMVISGEYSNGLDALNVINTQSVDILITDIKMPLMDGLTLTRQALQRKPDLKVIFISSHNDFDFVREGIKLGIVDYILKQTLETEELVALLKRCVKQLEDELEKKLELSNMRESNNNHALFITEQWLKKYLTDTVVEVEHMPSWLKGEYICMCVTLDRLDELDQEYGYMHKSLLLADIKETFYRFQSDGIACAVDEGNIMLVFPFHESATRSSIVNELHELLISEIQIGITIGYRVGCGIHTLRDSLMLSRAACKRRFFEGNGRIYSQPSQDEEDVLSQDENNLSSINLLEWSMKEHDQSTINEKIQWIGAQWKIRKMNEKDIKKEATQILSSMFAKRLDMFHIFERFDILRNAETMDDLLNSLGIQIKECLKLSEQSKVNNMGTVNPVEKAIEYIYENINNELNLQLVADYVHVSKNYFCLLFKKHTGQNFIDFVILYRIKRAKELLLESEKKVYEVAEYSGFNDVKYFSKLFKRITGFTPIEYREQNKQSIQSC